MLHMFKAMAFSQMPYAKFNAVIHDELLFQVPTHLLAEAKEVYYKAIKELNERLQWSVNMRFGWAEGKNFYEAK